MPQVRYPDGGVPNENVVVNPLGSLVPYLAPAAANATVTDLIQNKVLNKFIGTRPSKYESMLTTLLFGSQPEFFPTPECVWREWPEQRIALTSTGVMAAVGANANGYVTGTVTVNAASFAAAKINQRVYYKNTVATITGKTAPDTLTLKSGIKGGALEALAAGDIITPSAEVRADGDNAIHNHSRFGTVRRVNFTTTIMNTEEYGRKAYLAMKNGGTTDFLPRSLEELIWQTKVDAMVEIIRGVKGIQENADGKLTHTTDGIEAQYANAGGSVIGATMGNLTAVFEDALHNTAHKSSGRKLVVASNRLLTELSKKYKFTGTRYVPNDVVARLNLKSVEVGATEAYFVPCDLLEDPNYLPGFEGRMYLLDPDSIKPAGMEGMPYLDINGMVGNMLEGLELTDKPKGSKEDIKRKSVEATFAVMMQNAGTNAILNVAL